MAILPVLAVSSVYIGILFLIAWWGDKKAKDGSFFALGSTRAIVAYALTLAIYNTSWSFFGSVGRASATGYEFLPIYIGPVLLLVFGQSIFAKVLKIAKSQNATSIADFLAARYGKSQSVAAFVTLTTLIGVLPYIALQLKAVAASFDVVTAQSVGSAATAHGFFLFDTAFGVAVTMAVFTIVFGVRHIHASEHHRGLMLAIAFESLIKISAFIAVSVFIVFGMFDGFADLYGRIDASSALHHLNSVTLSHPSWYFESIISAICFMCLPHAFHVTVVENDNPRHVKPAAWLYPMYLLLFSLFMVPIAAAGLITFAGNVNPDTYMISLPIAANAPLVSLFSFIGGVSAATGMVIVAVVSLSTMFCNDVVIPLVLQSRLFGAAGGVHDISRVILRVRRVSVVLILMLAYCMYRVVDKNYPLTRIGFISFVAVAQFGPAFFGGLYWKKGNKTGALVGMVLGFAAWAYLLLLPALAPLSSSLEHLLNANVFDVAWLPSPSLFKIEAFDPISHATLWSLSLNILGYVACSFLVRQSALERVQADAFVSGDTPEGAVTRYRSRTSVSLDSLRNLAMRYVGTDRGQKAFDAYLDSKSPTFKSLHAQTGLVDLDALRFTENLIAGSVGAASARIVMASSLQGQSLSRGAAMAMLDEASEVLHFNRKLLQETLENVRQGICVVDATFRIMAWNDRYLELLDLPPDLIYVGKSFVELIEFNTQRGEYGADDLKALIINQNISEQTWPYVYVRQRPDGTVLEITYNRMPEGGYVSTHTDITERYQAAKALENANESLERHVQDRTEALQKAKAEAEQANAHKTLFLAAASHDLLQPLNAARLFISALEEKLRSRVDRARNAEGFTEWRLADDAAHSLKSAELLIDSLMDISSLDTGVTKPDIEDFALAPLLSRLNIEFSALAKERGLPLTVVPTKLYVRSDPQLLRRVLQNYLSNALRYTPTGRILLGCRRKSNDTLRIQVFDTGLGIPGHKLAEVFREFRRLDNGSNVEQGLGLGLAIVDRISKLLGSKITVSSQIGKGTCFGIDVPIASHRSISGAIHMPEIKVPTRPSELVLCVDNELSILRGFEALLTSWGYRVLTAQDRAQALALCGKTVPDIVLIDYHLEAGKTGMRVLDDLRSQWQRNVDALLVTADRSRLIRAEAESRGCQILYKPIKPASLRRFLMSSKLRKTDGDIIETAVWHHE